MRNWCPRPWRGVPLRGSAGPASSVQPASVAAALGDSVVRTALIWALAEATARGGRKDLGKAETLRGIGRRLGVRAAWQELAVLPLDRLKRLIEQEILPPSATVAPHAP